MKGMKCEVVLQLMLCALLLCSAAEAKKKSKRDYTAYCGGKYDGSVIILYNFMCFILQPAKL